jgi:elongation factor G
MSDTPVENVRTFAIMGHQGSGKTALTDALAFALKISDRLGSVQAGNSMADYMDAEKSRKNTIFSKPFTGTTQTAAGKALKLVFVDTPGYADFIGQACAAIRAADYALVVVDAAAGVQVGTRQAWKLCDRLKRPRAIVLTGLDKENTDAAKALADIRAAFGDGCVPATLLLPDHSRAIDVLTARDMPESLAGAAEQARTDLNERASETDDALIEKFLEGRQLTEEELSKGLKKAVQDGALIPVFTCLPLSGAGIGELIEGQSVFMPSPLDVEATDAEGQPVGAKADDPFTGFVWRTVNDEFVGQLAFVRVLGGTLRSDSEVFNASRGQKERVGGLLCLAGKKQIPMAEAVAGDIVAVPKLKATGVNDTLCATGRKVVCRPIAFPSPVTYMAVHAKTQADEDKLGTALSRVCEEDPTLRVDRNAETHQMVIAGMGDVHIDVAVERMKSRSNVEVVLDTPKVPYRETVTTPGQGHHKHKKQSGGRGQYGEVYLKIEPKPPEDEEWFVDAIVGGVIPGNYIPAIQKGLLEGMQAGAVARYPVMNVKVTVYDGSYHDVDSSEIAFKIAASKALKDGMSKAKAVLLEPIMSVKIMVPDHCMGEINGDISHRRGRILGMGAEDGMQFVTAEVPQSELFKYAAELRSMTAGQGSFEMKFERYDVVPSNVAQKIIAEAAKEKEEEG